MTPAAVKAARLALGMTQSQLGIALRMSPDQGRLVRNWESGRNQITGPASLALEALLSGWRPGVILPPKAAAENQRGAHAAIPAPVRPSQDDGRTGRVGFLEMKRPKVTRSTSPWA